MRAQLSLTPTVRFVWDPRPSSRNLLDRAFDFEFATGVFTDRTWRLVVGATRVTLGLSEGIPLVVAWVERTDNDDLAVRRIVAARLATRDELAPPAPVGPLARHPLRGRANLARLRATPDHVIRDTAPAALGLLPPDAWAQAHVARADLARPIALRVAPDAICWFRGPVVIPSTRDEARDLIFLRRHAAALRS